ncbi:hypothetical protein SYJ56_13830 [Algoriphagus sp. D3-2-R+10]|uniref:hypothetical protein n=1 Tax=Algoriphagus aurantiacus TaxID=3103948 RepID=UPI002B3D849F|nr:hypothetical protein [Algoriphagus sp. D3-2-R+10]MEB2776397.1 hypothetical protein [Algoriphagus sp. D3-2-R+10]
MKKISLISNLIIYLFLFASCTQEKTQETTNQENIAQQLQELTNTLTKAEKNDDLKTFLNVYTKNAISMPEYQPPLMGVGEIESFYKEIFQRQSIKNYHRTANEIIELDSTIIEIGTFTKEYTNTNDDSLLTQNGKYWNIWALQPDGGFKLKGELFGSFHQVENPASLTVKIKKSNSDKTAPYSEHEIPVELRAFKALDEMYVRRRAGSLKSDLYTQDAKFMPFAEPIVSGIEKIKPYFIEYTSRGEVNIDSISLGTLYYEYSEDYVLEYGTFNVKWSTDTYAGSAAGKGIKLWKRQPNKSLKIFRHAGSHDYVE